MDIKTALDKLYSLHQFGVKLGLENITNLLRFIGNPHKQLKAFHIAGSNGKGSTASFIASMLQVEGYKTGLFISPHLVKFNERIRINGVMISDEYVRKFITDLDEYIDEYSPTFFELTTALAFKYFAENKVEYAVIETGLGGRLDATNVLDPVASVITSISLEHTNILGDSVDKIAGEKAGIIKRGRRVFLGAIPEDAEKVLESRATEMDCELFHVKDFQESFEDYIRFKIDEDTHLNIYQTPLRGFYQIRNSLLASLVLMKSIKGIKIESILKGINNVIINSGITGRYEVYSQNPKIIFDSAHNEESIENFIREFEKEYKNYRKCSLIFGMMKDKHIVESLKKLRKFFDNIYATTINYERAAKINDLIIAGQEIGIVITPLTDAAKLITEFRETRSHECLIVLGSIYIVGEIKMKLVNEMT